MQISRVAFRLLIPWAIVHFAPVQSEFIKIFDRDKYLGLRDSRIALVSHQDAIDFTRKPAEDFIRTVLHVENFGNLDTDESGDPNDKETLGLILNQSGRDVPFLITLDTSGYMALIWETGGHEKCMYAVNGFMRMADCDENGHAALFKFVEEAKP